MYKYYKHKLNMLYPGGRLLCLSAIVLLAGAVMRFLRVHWLSNLLFLAAGIGIIILTVLLLVEKHEDKVLNEQAIRLDQKLQAGVNKKSFAMDYHGGRIWFEHLDSMGDHMDLVVQKFHEDLRNQCLGLMPSCVAVNLDETLVSEPLIHTIITAYGEEGMPVRKLVFVGLSRRDRRIVKRISKQNNCTYLIGFQNDFEKAKEWLIP